MYGNSQTDVFDHFAHEILSLSGSTVLAFTPATYGGDGAGCRVAVCYVETANIRYWLDGTDPSTTEGIVVTAGTTFVIAGRYNIKKFKAIAVSGSPKVHVSFGK